MENGKEASAKVVPLRTQLVSEAIRGICWRKQI